MADFYPYLIASLPMLRFGMKPPFSFDRFLGICRDFIPEADLQVLGALPRPEDYPGEGRIHPAVLRWTEFDTALRNELARARAARGKREAAAWLRKEEYRGTSPAPGIAAAMLQPSLPDAEKALDGMRWKALEDLATGHFFDLDVLVSYAYKLLILERWERIGNADGESLLGKALGS